MGDGTVADMTWTISGYREVINGRLHIDRIDVGDLVRHYGSPLFVFSEQRIRTNLEELRRAAGALHPRIKICYAAKANSLLGILRVIRQAGGDVEVNSGGELYKARRAGFAPDQIVFNGVSKTPEEVSEAIAAGIYAINVDSPSELELVEQVAGRLGARANVSLRIVPEVETGSHAGLQTALLTSKFGISRGDIFECLHRALRNPRAVNLVGLHIHVGSQTPDAEPYIRAFELVWTIACRLYRETGHRLRHLNLGGGFPIPYLHDSRVAERLPEKERLMLAARLDLSRVIGRARERATAQDGDLLEQMEIVFEPGRRIIADAGTLVTTIRNVKTRPETGETWLLLDAGYELLLSMSNYKWYYHLISAHRAGEPHTTPYKVAGPLCDGGDVYFDIEGRGRLPDYRLLPEGLAVGDPLAVLDAGAYTLAQASHYNGRPLPAVVLVTAERQVQLIRRRDGYDDLLWAEV